MGMSARRLQLAQQFGKEGYHVLGLQKTRVQRSAQFRCGERLVWTAAAEAGRSGVEVWLAEGQGVNARDVAIAIENPRCLVISVPLLGPSTMFVSAHGPAADSGEEQVRSWWSTSAEVLAAVARGQYVVLLLDANASLNEDAGIHCGGREASKENTAGTALKDLVAERALCIPQASGKFGRTWPTHQLDFIVVPLRWHTAVSDIIKVEPPEMLALNDFVDNRAVTLTISQRHEIRHDRARRMNFERAAILTKEAREGLEPRHRRRRGLRTKSRMQ